MRDTTDLLNLIKKAAVEAVEAGKPTGICFGKVTSASPLKILVEQKMTLSSAQLVLTRNVSDFEIEGTVNWSTGNASGGSGDSSFASHNHSIGGKKKIKIHNALKSGDEVVMIKQQGGQKYLVLDRVVKS